MILDHSRRPRNFGALPDPTVLVHGDNPTCGDEIDLGVKFGPDGSLQELRFSGQGCAISQASASLMTAKLKSKPRAVALGCCAPSFQDLAAGGGDDAPATLGDLAVMRGVRKFPQRVKCALLPWRALERALRTGAGEATVSTEAGPADSLRLVFA